MNLHRFRSTANRNSASNSSEAHLFYLRFRFNSLYLYNMSSLTLSVHCSPWLSYFKTSFVVASSVRVRFLRAVKKRFNNHANGENLSIRNYIISLSIYFFLYSFNGYEKNLLLTNRDLEALLGSIFSPVIPL